KAHDDVEIGVAAGLRVRAADRVFGEFRRGGRGRGDDPQRRDGSDGGREGPPGATGPRAGVDSPPAHPHSLLAHRPHAPLLPPPLQAFASLSSFFACFEACFACLRSFLAWDEDDVLSALCRSCEAFWLAFFALLSSCWQLFDSLVTRTGPSP